MKRLLTLLLTFSMIFSIVAVFPAQSAKANDEPDSEISWFVAGMTVGEAKALSPAIKYVKNPGSDPLDDDALIATGDIVVTDNGSYQAWVLGDVAGNGAVDQYDYILIKRKFFNTYTFNKQESFTADINSDGEIDE